MEINLFIVSLFVFIFGTIILYSYSKNIFLSFIISFIKVVIFYIYFYIGELPYTILDDIEYYEGSLSIYNNFNKDEFIYQLFNRAQGIHILYYGYNIFSFIFFGEYYYSPVALNIILTFLSALTLYKICINLLISKNNSLLISFFFCLHWDIVSWSSFLNIKDILIVQLLLLTFYVYMKNKDNLKKMLLKLFPILVIIYFIRFYLVFFILLAVFLASSRINLSYIFRFILISFIFFFFVLIYDKNILNIFLSQVKFDFVLNIIRFLLSPVPFNYEDGYNFLVFASLLNWLSFPFVVIGFILILKRKDKKYNFILILNVLIVIFFAGFDELLGPRQRLVLTPYLTILMFLGFQYIYKTIYFKRVKYEDSNIN